MPIQGNIVSLTLFGLMKSIRVGGDSAWLTFFVDLPVDNSNAELGNSRFRRLKPSVVF